MIVGGPTGAATSDSDAGSPPPLPGMMPAGRRVATRAHLTGTDSDTQARARPGSHAGIGQVSPPSGRAPGSTGTGPGLRSSLQAQRAITPLGGIDSDRTQDQPGRTNLKPGKLSGPVGPGQPDISPEKQPENCALLGFRATPTRQ